LTVILTALALIFTPQSEDPRWLTVRPYNAKLERMAWCESRKRWHIVTRFRTATYYGGLQFDLSTWRSVKGKGYPHRATKLEQKYRAVLLIRKRGYRPWPRCGSA
jgi:resuscitation-promoting factor RpfA